MTNISSHLKKEYWRRRVEPDAVERHTPSGACDYYVEPLFYGDTAYDLYTSEDFVRENTPSAHKINSRFMSLRPIYDCREVEQEDGTKRKEWYVSDFDRLETVRFGLQRRINLSKAAHFAGKLWISHEDKNHDAGDVINSWKDSLGLETAWQELVSSCFLTGDGAIYLYQLDNRLCYQVFSYLKGDVLFPDYDENHIPILYRLYTLRGKRAVDVFACGYIETWIEGDKDDERERSWFNKFGGWFAKGLQWNSEVRSEDGWRRISRRDTQISKNLTQCVYWRVDDIPSGICEQEICALETSASFLADGVKSTSQPILFLKAANIESLPDQDSTGKRIGVKGTVDEVAASDAKWLGVPDVSNIASIDIQTKQDSILKSSMSVNITSDVFRSGDPSSASMKLLFTDMILWCKNEYPKFYPQLQYLIEVFKALVAKIEGDGTYAKCRTSCGIDFYIPQNDAEVLKMELDKVYAKVKSRKAAISDTDNGHLEDYEQIKREWEEELEMKARIPAEAKAKVEEEYQEPQEVIEVEEESNPTKPGVDKNMKGRTILES